MKLLVWAVMWFVTFGVTFWVAINPPPGSSEDTEVEASASEPDEPSVLWPVSAWASTDRGSGPPFRVAFGGADCNGNGIPDDQDIAQGTSLDCNRNTIPDECEIAEQPARDCNKNGILDSCDIAVGTSEDINGDGVPDECQIANDGVTREFSAFVGDVGLVPAFDAMSREFSTFVGPVRGIPVIDASSREFSIFTGDLGPIATTDAVSREFSAFVGEPPISVTDASSREFSVFAGDLGPVATTDAVSREFSVCVVAPDPRPLPDLEVVSFTPPVAGSPGEIVEVSWVVRNAGDAPATGPWTETLLGSADPNVGNDVTLGSFVFDEVLAPGETRLRLVSVTIPPNLPPGNYFAIVCLDTQLEVAEINELNNCAAEQVCVDCLPPDLVVTSIVEPAFGFDGTTVEVTWTVTNQGGGPAPGAWVDAVYLSEDAVTGGDTLLAPFGHIGPLAAGGQYTTTQNVTIPAGTNGDVYIIVVTDAQHSVSEPGAEGNNSLIASGATTIIQPNLPDLQVTQIAAPGMAITGQPITLAWKVTNTDLAGTALGPWTDRIHLSDDGELDPDDPVIHSAEFGSALPPQTFYFKTVQLTLPEEGGTYWFFVMTDVADDVVETEEDNNLGVHVMDVSEPPYTATVQAGIEVAASDAISSVSITGQAISTSTQKPVPGVAVTVRIRVQGTRRVSMPLITDDNGNYEYTFYPLPGEAGRYNVFADHPSVMEDVSKPQDTFILHNLRAEPGQVSASLDLGDPYLGQVVLRNLADVPVSGITTVVEGDPAGVSVEVNAPESLASLGVNPLIYTLTAKDKVVPSGKVAVHIRVAIGGMDVEVETLQILFFVTPPAAKLKATPGSLVTTMLRGSQTLVNFAVTNIGGAPATGVQVLVPCSPNPGCLPGASCSVNPGNCGTGLWLNLATPQNLGTIMPGETRTVQLNLLPSSMLPLGGFNGQLVVHANEDNVNVPFLFVAVSDQVGSLSVITEDENAYYGEGGDPENGGGPRLPNAAVTVKGVDPNNPGGGMVVVAQGSSGDTGTLLIPKLFEGFYEVQVTAPGHGSFSTTVQIFANQTTEVRAFLPAQQVTIVWSVIPTEIEDVYTITIEAQFVTIVPAPVLTVQPSLIELALAPGESTQVNLVITNHGIIAAQNTELLFGAHPKFVFEPLITFIGTLAAQSSITVPLTITRLPSAVASGDDCTEINAGLRWSLVCIIDRWYYLPIYFIDLTATKPCTPSGGGGPGGAGGGGQPGGGPGNPFIIPPSYGNPITCDAPPVAPDEGPPPCKNGTPECCDPETAAEGGGQAAGGAGSTAGRKHTDPVRLYSGEQFHVVEDLRIPGRGLDFAWTRTYRSKVGPNTAMGNGWEFSCNVWLEADETNLVLHDGNGRADTYEPQPDNRWGRDEFCHDIFKNPDATYTLTFANKGTWNFSKLDGSITAGKLLSMSDRNGNTITYHYDELGRLEKVTDTLDRDIVIAYNPEGFIESVTDFAGRRLVYEYYQDGDANGSFGDLKSARSPVVTGTSTMNDFPDGKTTVYTYSTGYADDRLNHNLTSITDPKGQTYVQIEYYEPTMAKIDYTFDRVRRQHWGNMGDIVDLVYVPSVPSVANHQSVMKTLVNDRVGNVTEYEFDIRNRLVRMREFTGRGNPDQPTTVGSNRPTGKLRPGDPAFFETRYEWNNDSNLTQAFYPNGNITQYVYELELNPDVHRRGRCNPREIHHLPGTHTPVGDQPAIVELMEYGDEFGCGTCGFNFVTMHTDARGNVTMNEYDDSGNRTHTTHRIPSIVEDWEYNAFGQVTAHILPDNGSGHRRRDEYTYHDSGPQLGYLHQEIVDAPNLALTSTYEYDQVGNVTRMVDPRGNDTLYQVNALNQVVRERSREVEAISKVMVRYERDTYYDANNNVVRVDVQNVDDQGVLRPNSHLTTVSEYEILNRLTRICQESGEFIEAIPGATNLPTCDGLPQEHFVVTEHEYDANRNRTLTRFGAATNGNDPYNAVMTLYDERELPYREIRAPGHPESTLPTGSTLPVESIQQYDYDGNRNLIAAREGLAIIGDDIVVTPHITTYVFDVYDREVQTLDPMGNVTERHYDPNGNLVSEKVLGELEDVPGSTGNVRLSEVAHFFDAMDRLERTEEAFFGATTQDPILDGLAVTQTVYTPNSQVHQVINDNNHATTTSYDTANRRHVVTDAKANSVEYQYDANSNARFIIETDKSDLGNPDQVFMTEMQYDAIDRQTAVIDNIGNTNRSYYDSRSNRTRTLDALDHEVLYQFDGLNRLVRTIRDMDGTGLGSANPNAVAGDPDMGTESIVTEQGWDDDSRLVTQTDDNGNTTTYVYDALNRKTAEVYADFTEKHWFYDTHDDNIFWTDANQNQVTQTFDDADRLIRRDIIPGPGVSDDTTFEVYKYDGLTRLIWAEDDDTRVTRQHDSLGRVTTEVQELYDDPANPWPPATVACQYDSVGNMLTLGYPSGRAVTTTYDELERKKNISDADGMIAEYFYVGPDRVERRNYGNGTRSEWTYDGITGTPNPLNDFGVKRIVRTRHTVVGAACGSDADCPAGNTCELGAGTCVIDDRTYTWDPVGNKTHRKDVRPGGPGLTHDYSYDNSYRFRCTTVTHADDTIFRNTEYHLDGVNNRTVVTGNPDPGEYVGPYTLDPTLPDPADFQMNQYTTIPSEGRGYDLNGNLILRSDFSNGVPVAGIIYDCYNQMVTYIDLGSRQQHRYRHDVLGRRISKAVNANRAANGRHETRYVLLDWQEIEQTDAKGIAEVSVAYGLYIDEALLIRRNTEKYSYYTDDMYNVLVLSTQNGIVYERYDYGDFGKPLLFDGSGPVVEFSEIGSFARFNGRRIDPESYLMFYRTRYLDPTSGRFYSRDRIGMWGSYVNYGNGYAFVGNDPLSRLDPTGEDNPGCNTGVGTTRFPGSRCIRQCCAAHDECYFRNTCGAFSWITQNVNPFVKCTPCAKCNSNVAKCIANCARPGENAQPGKPDCYDQQTGFYNSNSWFCTPPSASPTRGGVGCTRPDCLRPWMPPPAL